MMISEVKRRASFPLFCAASVTGITALVVTPLYTVQDVKKIYDGKEIQYHVSLGWMALLIASTITYKAMKVWNHAICDQYERVHLIAFHSLKLLIIATLTTLATSEIKADKIETGSIYAFMLFAALIPYFLLFEDKPKQHLNAKGALLTLAILSGGVFTKNCIGQSPSFELLGRITQDQCVQQFIEGASLYVNREVCSISLDEEERDSVAIPFPWYPCPNGSSARLPYLYSTFGVNIPYGFLQEIDLRVQKGFWRRIADFPNLTQSQYNWEETNNVITGPYVAPITMKVNYVNHTDFYELFIEGQGMKLFNIERLCGSQRFSETLLSCLSPQGRTWWESIRNRLQ